MERAAVTLSTRERLRLWAASVAAVIWARRWKIVLTLVLLFLAKSCEWFPDGLAQNTCEALVRLLRAVPGP